jgi:AraC-like DNA-binding protein
MRSGITGVFREPDDFEAVLRQDGCVNLLVTGQGSFRARLIRIALHQLRLVMAEEFLARISFHCVPSDVILVSIALGHDRPLIWGGTSTGADEIVTLSAGHRAHVRSVARSHWGTIVVPTRLLVSKSEVLTGRAVVVPGGVCRWRPSAKACRHLTRLHSRAARAANVRADATTTSQVARALEQELINAIIACLSEAPLAVSSDTYDRHANIMGRLEDLLQARPDKAFTSAELCAALDVSGRTLRTCCGDHLGMGPNRYIRVRRMHGIRRALRTADPATARVSRLADQYGFGEAGRFAGVYRAWFGESPSVTLQHGAGVRPSSGRNGPR